MLTNVQAATINQNGPRTDEAAYNRRIAGKMFDKLYAAGVKNQIWGKLLRKSNLLKVLSGQPAATNRTAQVVVLQIRQIVGSAGRSEDFDSAFNPVRKHNRERWISVAGARLAGVVLPPVELIQVGTEYYVRDGHHRISVAKAMGQLDIEARIAN
jgi:hypothetical protein